jgi:predicted ABC-type ATPase
VRKIRRVWRRREKKIILIAGPNGAGKTTFAESFLDQEAKCPFFLNADLIAKKLSPKHPEAVAIEAGRMLLSEIAQRVAREESFAIETTLSGLSYARQILKWRKMGYKVKLVFLSLPSADVAVERVRARVIMGGHSIPEAVIRRRFDKGMKNFHSIYRKIVNSWILYDNEGEFPRVIAEGDNP